MSIIVRNSVYVDRITKCKSCEFYKKETQSCGTLVLGDDVIYNGEEKHLCGCVMPIKAKLAFLSCPIGKWNARLTKREKVRLRALLERIDAKGKIEESDRNELHSFYQKALDTIVDNTTCPPCVQKWVKELKESLAS